MYSCCIDIRTQSQSRFLSVLGDDLKNMLVFFRCFNAVILCNVNFNFLKYKIKFEIWHHFGRSRTVVHAGRGSACCEGRTPSV